MGKTKANTKNKRSVPKPAMVHVKEELISDNDEELMDDVEEEIENGASPGKAKRGTRKHIEPELATVKEELLSDEEEEMMYDDDGVPLEFSTGKVNRPTRNKRNTPKAKPELTEVKEEALSEEEEEMLVDDDDDDDEDFGGRANKKGKRKRGRKPIVRKLVESRKVKKEDMSDEEFVIPDSNEDFANAKSNGRPKRTRKTNRIVHDLVESRNVKKEEMSDEDGISADDVDDSEYEPPARKSKRTYSPRKITNLPTLEKEEVMMDTEEEEEEEEEEGFEDEEMSNDASFNPISFNDESTIQTIIEQVQSVQTEDKICGLQVLANAFTDEEAISKLIEKQVIKIVIPFLLDENSEVRNFTAGALRNLSACGSEDVCELLVKEGIMTPLVKLIQQYGDCKPDQSKPEKENENTDTLVQAMHLLWNLCELDETAWKYFNSSKLLDILINCLDFEVLGLDLAIAACQCLNTVSEDNPEVISSLKDHETQLMAILASEKDSTKMLFLKTNVAGLIVTCNLSPNGLLPVITTLSHTINTDAKKKICDLSSKIPVQKKTDEVPAEKTTEGAAVEKTTEGAAVEKKPEEAAVEKNTEDAPVEKNTEETPVENNTGETPVEKNTEPLDKETEALLEECMDLLGAQITALEILANICSSQDDEKGQEDDPLNDGMDQDEEGWKDAVEETQPIVLSPDLYEALLKFKMLQSTYQNTNIPAQNVCDILNNFPETSDLMKKVYRTRCRAFLCYSNMISVLDLKDLGGADHLYSTWVEIGKLMKDKDENEKDEFMEAATSALRAIVLRLAAINYPKLRTLSPEYEDIMQVLLHVGVDSKAPLVRGNIVRILGTLGALCGNNGNMDMTMAIGIFLMGAAEKETDLWLLAETLDAIMDVFAEDVTDEAASKISLVNQLKISAALLNRKIRQEHAKRPDEFSVVSTAAMNLSRFITYKGARLDKVKTEVS